MKPLQIRSILLFCLLLFLISCASFPKSDPEKKEILLSENLAKWENFRIDGIIEYNYKQFAFRKNISLRKKADLIRIDIYDSGIFGLRPTPFISAYLDSLLYLRAPDYPDLISISKEEFPEDFYYLNVFLYLSQLKDHKSEIIKKNRIFIDNRVEFIFSENMLLNRINDDSTNSKINFSYEDNLSGLELYNQNIKILNIQVDKISFTVQEIKQLK